MEVAETQIMYCESRIIWPSGLLVSASDYRIRGLGSTPRWAPKFQCMFRLPF